MFNLFKRKSSPLTVKVEFNELQRLKSCEAKLLDAIITNNRLDAMNKGYHVELVKLTDTIAAYNDEMVPPSSISFPKTTKRISLLSSKARSSLMFHVSKVLSLEEIDAMLQHLKRERKVQKAIKDQEVGSQGENVPLVQ